MSERRKVFQRIIGGSKKKGKQPEIGGVSGRTSEANVGGSSKRRAITPPGHQGSLSSMDEIEVPQSDPEERVGRRKTPEPAVISRRRSSTPVASYERSS